MHGKKAFTPEMLSEPEPVALISATHDVLAEELGSLGRSIPDEMARALDENIFLFSGFKTYHEMNDASRLLRDEDGGFKPFDRFLQGVQAIDAQYNQLALCRIQLRHGKQPNGREMGRYRARR